MEDLDYSCIIISTDCDERKCKSLIIVRSDEKMNGVTLLYPYRYILWRMVVQKVQAARTGSTVRARLTGQ